MLEAMEMRRGGCVVGGWLKDSIENRGVSKGREERGRTLYCTGS